MWASLTKDSLRWATFTPSQWRRWLQVVIEKYYTRWENDLTSTPTRVCARKLPLFLTRRSSATRQRAMSHIWWSGLGGLVRGYLYQAAGRGEKGEITLFLRSQPWIKRSLTHRRCWSFWSLVICSTCTSLSLQLSWISKHLVEPFEIFLLCSNIFNKPWTIKKKKKSYLSNSFRNKMNALCNNSSGRGERKCAKALNGERQGTLREPKTI